MGNNGTIEDKQHWSADWLMRSPRLLLKVWFHEPTNHDDERDKTADKWKLTKNNRSV